MMMRYRGGFRLGRCLVRIGRRVFRLDRRRRKGCYVRLDATPSPTVSNPGRGIEASALAARVFDWGRSLSRRLRHRLGHRPPLPGEEEDWRPPPKGHLAVYVGGGRKDVGGQPPRRYVVPVIYFNHPSFAELLREAEEEFGFHHAGGITIPCPAAEFERVRKRVASAGRHLPRKSSIRSSML
ncbi:Auxin responsive protein [Musa troglodytarum]|uniref:Auxin responsive protein n=1 Tax=Musa troglodytarum TaxID=320322 RepID=A0A9E7ELX9_9LILI|nr:auxin-responsive [Musa troglodytarum]URD82029.1 Auxin responsive protein [Musa troglodytarum]